AVTDDQTGDRGVGLEVEAVAGGRARRDAVVVVGGDVGELADDARSGVEADVDAVPAVVVGVDGSGDDVELRRAGAADGEAGQVAIDVHAVDSQLQVAAGVVDSKAGAAVVVRSDVEDAPDAGRVDETDTGAVRAGDVDVVDVEV